MMKRIDKEYIIINADNCKMERVMGNHHLSANFQVYEFVSTDSSQIMLYSQKHVNMLQALRDYYDKPVNITSGHRELELNYKENGYIDSEHLYGYATDLYVAGVTPLELWHKCIIIGGHFCNVQRYKNHVHFGTKGFHRRVR